MFASKYEIKYLANTSPWIHIFVHVIVKRFFLNKFSLCVTENCFPFFIHLLKYQFENISYLSESNVTLLTLLYSK
jgi:hypothetical protein